MRNAEAILSCCAGSRTTGKTIIMVTHDPRALRFVDHAFHLDKGLLLEGDDAERANRAMQLAAGGGLLSASGDGTHAGTAS